MVREDCILGNRLMEIPEKKLRLCAENQLYALFIAKTWSRLTGATRLRVLQEIENRSAARDGRRPLKVVVGDIRRFDEEEGLRTSVKGDEIHVSYRFIRGGLSGLEAMESMLYIGRRITQVQLPLRNPKALRPQTLAKWLSAQVVYLREDDAPEQFRAQLHALRLLQDVEMDARSVPRRAMRQLAIEQLKANRDSEEVLQRTKELYAREFELIRLARAVLNMDLIDKLEKLILERTRERFPNLDLNGVRLFGSARMILNARLEAAEDYLDLVNRLDDMIQLGLKHSMDFDERVREAV